MRTPRLQRFSFGLALAACTLSAPLFTAPLLAQTNQSGDIAGVVTDGTGAIIAGAKVVVSSQDTGTSQTVTTNSSGGYRISLLKPGTYKVDVAFAGFQETNVSISVTPGQVSTGNVKLAIGSSSVSVEVSEQEPLLNTENADLSTSFSLEQVQQLPNPGNDLTFVAQTAPGVVMNTQGGYGNFSAFGLPATSNTFTVNGGYENDPFLNLNNSGATNLLLGNNDISEVTVISNPYTAQFGGLGGAQVNEISRSGTNHFHGDATYYWNGSRLNAIGYFNDQAIDAGELSGKPRSNANQWSGGIGGPIFKDKTFFFFDTEGLRVIIPVNGNVYAPSPTFVTSTIANVTATQGAAAATFVKGLLNEYTKNPAYAKAQPLPGTTDVNAAGVPNVVVYRANAANFAHEVLYTGRIDQNIGKNDLVFLHFKIDKGVQPTFTSLLDPIFDTNSPQPEYEGQLNETHTFNSHLTNQFVAAAIYYKAIFQNTNQAAAGAIAPFSLFFVSGDLANNSAATSLGGIDFAFPQGRDVTGYQYVDDLSYVKGKHTIKTGLAFRRDDVTDYGPQQLTTPELFATESNFNLGLADGYQQDFPNRLTQPLAVYTLGFYLQDEWKLLSNLTVTAGMRFEHNSDPKCLTNCFSVLSTDFQTASTSLTTPYNQIILTGQNKAFKNFQKVSYEPRIGFSYSPFTHTVLRGGFGFFADSFPAQIADSLLNNAPTNVPIAIGSDFGGADGSLYPAQANSLATQAAASSALFKKNFSANASNKTLSALGFSSPSFVNAATKISNPTYEEFSLQIQQQLTRTAAVNIGYTGNHGYHEPVVNNSLNAYNAGGVTGFAGFATVVPNGNFAQVTQVYSGASSNYNGMVISVINRSKMLTTQINYSWSHALDEISNGGFNAFSGNSVNPINPNPALLRQNYGNADYDTRNYFSGNYVFNLPYYGGPHLLSDGWQITGDAFHSTGLPFSFTDTNTTAGGAFANYGGTLLARQLTAGTPKKCSGEAQANGTPCAAVASYGTATNFGQQERNQVFGPDYTDTDITVSKAFHLSLHPRTGEGPQLRLGVQIFNVLNHPNFGQPLHDSQDGAAEGTITSTVNPPTSILGSFLGGDASPRLIQLKAKISF